MGGLNTVLWRVVHEKNLDEVSPKLKIRPVLRGVKLGWKQQQWVYRDLKTGYLKKLDSWILEKMSHQFITSSVTVHCKFKIIAMENLC